MSHREGKDPTVYDDRAYLAAFCTQLPQLRRMLERAGRGAALEDAVRAVRAGTPVLDVLAPLDVPPSVLLPAPVTRWVGPGDIVAGLRPDASGEAYHCPGRRCDLVQVREPGGPIPAGGRCWLRDEPLLVEEA